jgi:hypothetical protein
MHPLVLALAAALTVSGCTSTSRVEASPRARATVAQAAAEAPHVDAPAGEEAPASRFLERFFAPKDDYELDDLDRSGPPRGRKPSCEQGALVSYRGSSLRYDVPASVHRAFVARLARFEEVAAEVAREVYGRAPTRLHHAGGYMCRVTWRGRLSEHSLGNALDVSGFSFAPIAKADLTALRERGIELAPADRRAFRIDVGETWRATGSSHASARRFFALLLARVRARSDVFRGMIGPPDPAHTTHLHLDAGRWSFSRYEPPAEPPAAP